MPKLVATPLTAGGFAPYGHVVAYPAEQGILGGASSANQGTAERFNFVAPVVNYRAPDGALPGMSADLVTPPAVANLSLFRCLPTPALPFTLRILERHPYSTQLFVPIATPPFEARHGYLVVVAKNDPPSDRPDFTTLAAFICQTTQAISYSPGTWHAPMVALERVQDFVCLVHERRQAQRLPHEDCEEVELDGSILVDVPAWRGAEKL